METQPGSISTIAYSAMKSVYTLTFDWLYKNVYINNQVMIKNVITIQIHQLVSLFLTP